MEIQTVSFSDTREGPETTQHSSPSIASVPSSRAASMSAAVPGPPKNSDGMVLATPCEMPVAMARAVSSLCALA